MALTLTRVPDCDAPLGSSQFEDTFQVNPAVSDYPSGGYPITANELALGNLYGAWVISANAAAAIYEVEFVQPAYSTPPTPPIPGAQLNMLLTVGSTGSQVAASVDLSACVWIVRFLAQGE